MLSSAAAGALGGAGGGGGDDPPPPPKIPLILFSRQSFSGRHWPLTICQHALWLRKNSGCSPLPAPQLICLHPRLLCHIH